MDAKGKDILENIGTIEVIFIKFPTYRIRIPFHFDWHNKGVSHSYSHSFSFPLSSYPQYVRPSISIINWRRWNSFTAPFYSSISINKFSIFFLFCILKPTYTSIYIHWMYCVIFYTFVVSFLFQLKEFISLIYFFVCVCVLFIVKIYFFGFNHLTV